jgi:hypothetical protein
MFAGSPPRPIAVRVEGSTLPVSPLNRAARIFLALTAACGLQFPLTLADARSLGMTAVGGIVTYFRFFTILTNFLIAVQASVAVCLPNSPRGRVFLHPGVSAACTVYIGPLGMTAAKIA